MRQKRLDFAYHIIRCVDTVTLLDCDEVIEIINRALNGEFDSELAWRSPYLK
jgi:hypothetical protein